jgi:hypothetical protein
MWAHDGTSLIRTAQLTASVDGTPTAGIVPTRWTMQTMDSSGNYETRLTVRNSGMIGIGTESPATRLHVMGGVRAEGSAPDDTTPNNAGWFELSNRGPGGGAWRWRNYTAAIGGGSGVTANGWDIWEYPTNAAPNTCCRPRFRILPSDAAATSSPAVVTIDGAGTLQAAKITTTELGASQINTTRLNADIFRGVTAPHNSGSGFEHNVLFNAPQRYVVTQTGGATIGLSAMFDGRFVPSYSATAPTANDPTVILIEGLPGDHTQAGSWFGWSIRYWHPKHFKVRGYDVYQNANTWVEVVDYSVNAWGEQDFIIKMPSGVFEKIELTIYEATGQDGRLGLSELFFLHPEAARPYAGLLPENMYSVGSNVGIGTNDPQYTLHVMGTVAATSILSLSTRDAKRDITPVSAIEEQRMLERLARSELKHYYYKDEFGSDGRRKLGFIAEEMPPDMLASDGKSIDVYALLGHTVGAMKAQQRQLATQQNKMAKLEARLSAIEGRLSGVR